MARLAGLEPATAGLEGRCSIQLSYRRLLYHVLANIGRGGEIRTPDPLLPKQMRYQAALHPEHTYRSPQQRGSLSRRMVRIRFGLVNGLAVGLRALSSALNGGPIWLGDCRFVHLVLNTFLGKAIP